MDNIIDQIKSIKINNKDKTEQYKIALELWEKLADSQNIIHQLTEDSNKIIEESYCINFNIDNYNINAYKLKRLESRTEQDYTDTVTYAVTDLVSYIPMFYIFGE